MYDILNILQLILFISFIIIFYFKLTMMNKQTMQLKNQIEIQNEKNEDIVVSKAELLFEKIKENLEEVMENDRTQLYQLYKVELANLEETKKDNILAIDQVIEQLKLDQMDHIQKLDQFQEKIGQDFEGVKVALVTHVNARDAEHDLWLERISRVKNEPQKAIEMVESALSQFPYSRSLFEVYLELLNPYLINQEQKIKKKTAEKLNRASRIFLDYCSVDNWNFAIEKHNEILKYGQEIMVEIYKERKASTHTLLSKLEINVDQLEAGNAVEDKVVERIESLESSIDKALIEREPQLLSTYKRLSKRLINYYSKDQQEDEVAIRNYNLKAVKQIKEAYDYFVQDEKAHRTGVNLSYFIARLSGWDTQYLKEETQIYFQAIYSEIFGKLNSSVKPNFTESMLNSNKKVV